MTKTITIDFGQVCFDADLSIQVELENNGIGSYEYWGAPGFDAGSDYMAVEDITWDRTLYTDTENKLIELYVECNLKDLEREAVQKAWEDYNDMLTEAALNRAGL